MMENKTANRGAREAAIKNLNTIAESVGVETVMVRCKASELELLYKSLCSSISEELAEEVACDLRDRVPLRPLVQNSKYSDDIVEAKFVCEAMKSELCSLSQNVSGRHNTCV